MAHSIFNPSLTCIFQNLMRNIADYPDIKDVGDIPWVLDYMHGSQIETYIIKFSDFFVNQMYSDVAHEIYFSRSKKLNFSTVVLIGVKSFHSGCQTGKIMINPYNYMIQGGDYAIVISNNIEEALLVQEYEDRVDLH